ncbi:glycoside hydrolase family 76 protein [Amniculicola lignicola CBS 123094]|uniref:Mannan endo-1,6-alpha-mannosidase n=1 Tax=Amniculicola lignicola CBS 123094 TaxID=1392246 RepID=A0A6A5WIT8_9PLEO|nr:glycoside hydrolase family 76 protein [Amniculicola lignicola CBS 123094]
MRLLRPAQALSALLLAALNVFPTAAIVLDDPTDPAQLKSAAKTIATDLMAEYATTKNGQVQILSGVPGLLPKFSVEGYYWWEAGAMFGTFMEYAYYTNDSQFSDIVRDGYLFQLADSHELLPANQSKDMGNDDQLFWAFASMTAAELKFKDPPDNLPGYLATTQSVFNQLVKQWDPSTCGGGVRWQLHQWHTGYNYKNTAANGGFFQLAARLALYTGNQTYADWADKIYDWMASTPLLGKDYKVNDGLDTDIPGCTKADGTEWTYNYGIIIGASAYMYNYTNGAQVWKTRLEGYIEHVKILFVNGTMYEPCEAKNLCDTDQYVFKTFLARWLALAAQIAPITQPTIMPLLQTSARNAARQCDGGESGTKCGSNWRFEHSDGKFGVGQQMTALSVIQANLILLAPAPSTGKTGGTSKGDPGAGTGGDEDEVPYYSPIATKDKAGAVILTMMAVVFTVGGAGWLVWD